MANDQRNSQIANQTRALNVATFKHAENLQAADNGRSSKVFFRHRNNNFVAENSSNNENTVKSTAFWLSAWKKWWLEEGIAKEIEN